jgi:hypothetical protein
MCLKCSFRRDQLFFSAAEYLVSLRPENIGESWQPYHTARQSGAGSRRKRLTADRVGGEEARGGGSEMSNTVVLVVYVLVR